MSREIQGGWVPALARSGRPTRTSSRKTAHVRVPKGRSAHAYPLGASSGDVRGRAAREEGTRHVGTHESFPLACQDPAVAMSPPPLSEPKSVLQRGEPARGETTMAGTTRARGRAEKHHASDSRQGMQNAGLKRPRLFWGPHTTPLAPLVRKPENSQKTPGGCDADPLPRTGVRPPRGDRGRCRDAWTTRVARP